MKTAVPELKWFQFRKRILDWQKKYAEEQALVVAPNEERSISILQKRYGFSREQAIYQLRKYYPNARLEG